MGSVANPRLPTSARLTALVVGAIAIAGLALRVAVLVRPIGVLDRLFVPDDTYYTLTIARSIAHGLGPTTDGSTLTSGFQPLLGFLMVPVYLVTDHLDGALRVDVILLVIADTVTTLLLARVAWRVAGAIAAVVTAVVWAVSPIALSMALGGLETSLAITVEIGLVAVWIWAADAPDARRWAVVGLVAGLAVLARIDALALVALLALVQVWRGSWRALVPTALVGLATVGPWWLWCWWNFGTPLPTSGPAAHDLAGGAPFASATFARVAGAVVGGPFTLWNGLRDELVDRPGRGVAAFVAIVVVLLVIAVVWSRAGSEPTAAGPSVRQLVATLPVFAAVLMVFYVWFGVTYYFTRYLAPVAAVATLLVGVGVARAVDALRAGGRGRIRSVIVLAGAALVVVVGLGAAAVGDERALTATERTHGTLDAETGFRVTRRPTARMLPTGAVVGAWQSGALSYYGGDRITVVNLDGVVNPEAPRDDYAATARYVRRRGAHWLADWNLFLVTWRFRALATLHPPPKSRTVRDLPAWPGASLRYQVWRVEDPARRAGRPPRAQPAG